jgi:hypothetical protein
MNRQTRRDYLVFAATALPAALAVAERACPLPKGLMLNLDFQQIKDGLIPNKTLYPLYVPLAGLDTLLEQNRSVLAIMNGQHLDIPHSSLLDPDGSEWIATVRVFALSDGIVMAQGNDENGFVIYIKDGAAHAAIRTLHSTATLTESKAKGITDCLNKWITIELSIKPETATLLLNRARVAGVLLQAPLSGDNHRIRIGEHSTLPAPLQFNATATPAGFTGAISSIKLLRQ